LLNVNGQVHARDQKAVAALLARGVIVSLCTGRMYSGTRPVAEQLGLQAPVACVDGCHVVQSNTHECLLRWPIPAAARATLRTLLGATDLAVFAFSDDTIVFDERGRGYLEYLRTWSTDMRKVPDIFAPERWDRFDALTALVVIGSQASTESVLNGVRGTCDSEVQLAHFPLLRGHLANRWVLLVRRAGVNKGTAVKWLAERFGIPLEDVVAIGDWINDVPMFAVAGRSFVMGQSPPEVKAAASHQLRATVVTGGAIAEAAERCGLI
jgi:Cof subfamily protein (haloacid dehalogenase superfamily)